MFLYCWNCIYYKHIVGNVQMTRWFLKVFLLFCLPGARAITTALATGQMTMCDALGECRRCRARK